MFKRLIIPLGLLLLPSANAEDSEHLAQTAYKQALERIVEARTVIADGRSISFMETTKTRSGAQQSMKKQLNLDEKGNEVLYTEIESQEESEQIRWQFNVLVQPNSFPEQPELIKETESTWTFRIPTEVTAGITEPNQAVDRDKINKNIRSALVTELTVSKQSPQFLAMKVFAKKPFKPEAMVKVREFIVRFEFAEAWSGGPLVTRTASRVLKGSYAFFVDVEEFSIITHHQFEQRQ